MVGAVKIKVYERNLMASVHLSIIPKCYGRNVSKLAWTSFSGHSSYSVSLTFRDILHPYLMAKSFIISVWVSDNLDIVIWRERAKITVAFLLCHWLSIKLPPHEHSCVVVIISFY